MKNAVKATSAVVLTGCSIPFFCVGLSLLFLVQMIAPPVTFMDRVVDRLIDGKRP